MSQPKSNDEYLSLLQAEADPVLPPARMPTPANQGPALQAKSDEEKPPIFGANLFSVVVNGVACRVTIDAGFPQPIP